VLEPSTSIDSGRSVPGLDPGTDESLGEIDAPPDLGTALNSVDGASSLDALGEAPPAIPDVAEYSTTVEDEKQRTDEEGCPKGTQQDGGRCCPKGTSNSGGKCCPNGTRNDGGKCCPNGTRNDGGRCCPNGTHNSGGVCRPNGK
jgi:hypothetical protein